MKRASATLILSLTLFVAVWSQPNSDLYSDRYLIVYKSPDTDRIHIDATVHLQDSLLYMSPYGPLPQRWSQYIENLAIKGPDGMPVAVSKTKEGTWIVQGGHAGQTVALSYEMVLSHEEIPWPGGIDGVAFRREWGVMASGRSLFVMNGKDKKDIEVRVEVPGAWNVSTPWEAVDRHNTYRANNLLNLQESFLVAGTHEEKDIIRDGFTLKFVLGGEGVKAEKTRFIQVASGVMDYYINLMGGVPKPQPGMELKQSLVMINQSEKIDGEVIGNHLSMFMNPGGSSMDQMVGWFMFAHEFFHLWNGKTLRFANTTTDWFREGISNYYTIKALAQTGFINEEIALAMLNNLFYQRYVQDPGYGTLSPSQAASGFDKDNHWGLVYGGGLFAGIAMDMEIRHRSGNSHSLDDLMRDFYEQYGGTDRLIGQDDILAKANQLGSTDFSGLMKEHILGPTPVSLTPYLKFAGIAVVTTADQLEFTHNPAKTDLQAAIWRGFMGGK